MAKFIIQNNFKLDENNNDKINNLSISDNEDDDFTILNKSNKNRLFKIGKLSLDEECITRAAIVKLTLLKYPIKEITKILKVSRMLAWKWAHFENYEATGKRKTKLDYNEQQFLLKKTEGKIVGIDAPSSRELKKEFFEEYNKNISHTTINNFLNKSLSKPLKVVNTFLLTDSHEEKRKKFADFILENNINTNNLFFTDECRVVLYPKLNKQNNVIRFNKEDRKQRWKPEIEQKRENATPKFEQSIMMSGGICKYGLSNLIFCSGTQNNFSYKQFLLFMKEDMEKIQKEYNLEEPLIFQQDNAACHTSYDSKSIIEILFNNNTIEWPPNSPDLSPIENVWAILKEKLSKRKIKNLDDLRDNILDIWTKFPNSLCEKLCSQFNYKIKYVSEYGGKRINNELLAKIIREQKDNNEALNNEDNEWISIKRDNNFRIVFNDKIIKTIKARYLKQLKKQKEEKINLFDEDNKKLGKGDKNYLRKVITKKEFNDNIDKNRDYLIEYYDKKIKEIEDIGYEKFILQVLNREKNENLKRLMCTNLNANFSLNDFSTDVSGDLDNKIDDNNYEDEDSIKFNQMLDKKMEENKKYQLRKYINDKMEVDNYFPYEQKKLRRNNKDEDENKNIYNILKKLTELNEKLEKYKKENNEKETKIDINQENEENEEDSLI